MTQNLAPTATFTTLAPANATFSLAVLYQGNQYELYFSGNATAYSELTEYQNQAFGSQAQYLSAFLTNSVTDSSNCCAINGVWVYANGQPLAASQIPAGLLSQTLLWAYGYLNFGLTPGGTADLQSEYTQVQLAVQNETTQQAGIVLANLANLATVIGPVTQDLESSFGSGGANQLAQEIQLITDIAQGSEQVYKDYPTCGSSVISTLENLDLVTSANYTPASFILALSSTLAQNQNGMATAQALYSTAYSSTCSSSAALLSEPVAAKAGDFLLTVAANVANSSAVQGGSVFAEAYFQYGLTNALAGQIATSAAFDDILSGQVPAAIGAAVISSYIMPQAALLQEEVNIQNLLNSAFPQFFAVASADAMTTEQASTPMANISNGVQAVEGLGVLYSFQSLWFATDYQLVSSEFCITCANSPTNDSNAAITYGSGAQQVLSIIGGAASLASSMNVL